MLEIGLDPLGAVGQKLHEGCCLLQQPIARAAALGVAQMSLEVPVEVFIGVALRRVGREVEHLNLVRMGLHPGAYVLGMVRAQVVEYQEHLAPFAVLHEPLHETEGRLGGRCPFEELKAHQALAADGRNHRQTKALARGCEHRRMSRRGVTPHPVTILRHRCLIGPVDDGVLLLSLLRNQGVDLLHPALYVPGLLLQRPAGGTLRRVAPALQVLAHRADRHLDVEISLDETAHRAAVPQGKRQAPCRGRLACQDRAKHPFLRQRQGAPRQVGATGLPGHQARFPLSRVTLRPAKDSGGVQAHDLRDFSPRQAQLLAQPHRLAAQRLECISGYLSSVDLVHDK